MMSNDGRDLELDQICHSLREELSAYIDGELSVEREAAVGQHLSSCSACSAFLANLNSVDNLLLGLQAPDVPGLLLTSIKDQIRQEESRDLDSASVPPPHNASWTWSAPLLAAAAVLVLLAVVRFNEDPVSGQVVNQDSSQAVIENAGEERDAIALVDGLEEEELLFSIDFETIEEMELLEDLDVVEAMAREQRPDLFSGKATRS
jgi:anti-sigma factor RsiW